MRQFGKTLAMTMSGVCSLAISMPALAQEAEAGATVAPPEQDPEAGEIIVTAQKRAERLQDVPLAVTAISGEALAARQINDTSALVKAVPSLNYQQGNSPANSTFRVRGVGTSLFGVGVESSVSVVIDGVVLARQVQGFADLADIERIEVLRGPQGTLFGKNATAGVVNVITARPSNGFEARGSATIAEKDEYRIAGTASGPISDTLRARISGFYNAVGGHIRNVTTKHDDNGFNSWGLRGKLEWDATDRLNVLVAGDYRRTEADCCQPVFIRSDNAALTALNAPVVPGPGNRELRNNVTTFYNTNQQTYSIEANLDLDSAIITSISAYQRYKFRNNADVDAIDTPIPIFTGPSFAQFDVNAGQTDLKQFTQELRLTSKGKSRFNYVIGAYYLNLDIDRSFQRRLANCPTGVAANVGLAIGAACPAPLFLSGGHNAKLANANYSVFAQGDFEIVPKLRVIAGIRALHETVSVAGTRTGLPLITGDTPLFGAVTGRRSARDTAVTGRAGLQYEFSRNAQIYGTWSHGYKGQGFDTEITANFATQNPVRPETVNAWEIGFKGSTLDRSLTVAAAAFWSDYKNLQVQANRSDPTTGNFTFVQTNAGSSRSRGFEVEATLRPSSEFSVAAAVTYVDAKVDADGLSCALQNQAAAPILAGNFPVNSCFRAQTVVNGTTFTSGPQQNVRGGKLPASPKWRINISPRYEHEFSAGKLTAFAQADLSFQSDQIFAVEQNPLTRQPSYTIVDASVGVKQTEGGLSLALFVKNLFDTHYYTTIGSSALLTTAALTPNNLNAYVPKAADRYFGATVGFEF